MNAPQKRLDKKDAKPTGIIAIHGREYQTVAYRVQMFREAHPDWALTTAVMVRDEECVVMQATIADETGRVLATGHSEEFRKSSQINRTSALENAETSAIGRALAALGLGGTEFATANEVQNAIHQQSDKAKEVPFAQGPAKNKTSLKDLGRAFWRDVEACEDEDTLVALVASHKPLIDQLKAELPTWWDGGQRDSGEPFEGLSHVIDRNLADFANLANTRTPLDAG